MAAAVRIGSLPNYHFPCGTTHSRPPRRQHARGSGARGRPAARMSLSACAAAAVASRKAAAVAAAAAAGAGAACEVNPSLARVWREIQGANDWADLVEPLHPLLRAEVVRYGEFVGACYNAFDLDAASKRYLNCKYGKKSMLREVGMGACGYEVTRYIYATPDIAIPTQPGTCCGRWMGYVAVASDDAVRRLGRRDVVVSFRGTVTSTEWIANFMSSLTPARLDPGDPRPAVKVESGFLSMYTSDDRTCRFGHGSCREQLLAELSRIISRHAGEEISITFAGHSMGSSLAILAAYDVAELGVHRRPPAAGSIPITVYSFGGPRVGNSAFKSRCEELGVKVLRVVNVNDPVTKMPGIFLNETLGGGGGASAAAGGGRGRPWSLSCYAHVGVELALDFFKMKDPAGVHDLGAYLGLLKRPAGAVRVRKEGDDLVGKVMRVLSSYKLDPRMWQDAAINMGNLVQSLGI